MRCASCTFESPDSAKFCSECGTPLRETPLQPAAERRQLTVMFCDLVGSTELSEQLDPEDWRDVLRTYQHAAARAIERFEGHIAQYLGDGLLVYFGHPVAHEDDAQRAVHAALAVLTEMRVLNERLEHERNVVLPLRTGIHTGLVVVGEVGAGRQQEMLSVGATPNIAARLQALAGPDEVVVSGSTFRLLEGYFTCESLGARQLRGIAQPLEVFRVVEATGATSRLQAASTRGLTPLIGRDTEIRVLLERWQETERGASSVVLLNGEAGIGKSRLIQEIRGEMVIQHGSWLECRCSPYHRDSSFHPVLGLLRAAIGITADDTADEAIDRIASSLTSLGLSDSDNVPLLAGLLAIPLGERYVPVELPPPRRRERTFELLYAFVDALGGSAPRVLLVEDLHWADPSTLEFLEAVVRGRRLRATLHLFTHRPDFVPRWEKDGVTEISLDRVTRSDAELIVSRVAHGRSLPREVIEQVVAKTDGVPLFVEELTKMLLESNLLARRNGHYELVGRLEAVQIPATLQDSLIARLDRVAGAKEVAQVGATIGREFAYELIRELWMLDRVALDAALDRLMEAELVYRSGTPPRATYSFKHALVQDAAYESQLKSKRKLNHERIATVLERRFPDVAQGQPEVLARHYTEAELPEHAVRYWLSAGQRAVQRSANQEAIAHLERGLRLVERLPVTTTRAEHELSLLVTLATPLIATKGYSAPEVGQALSRARELCADVGDTPQLFPVLFGLWLFYVVAVDLGTARQLAEQLLALAERSQDPGLLLEGHCALAVTSFYRGEFAATRNHVERGVALYEHDRHRAHAYVYGQDPGMVALGYGVRSLPLLGLPRRTAEAADALVALSERLTHRHSLGGSLMHLTVMHLHRREPVAALERADALVALSTEHELLFWLAMARMLRGAALVFDASASADADYLERATAEAQGAVAAYEATGAGLDVPVCIAALAEGLHALGRTNEGVALLDGALAENDRTGQHYYDAELHRLRGMLVHGRGDDSEAERSIQRAVELARRQGARLLELRAVVDLALRGDAAAKARTAELVASIDEDGGGPDIARAHESLSRIAASSLERDTGDATST